MDRVALVTGASRGIGRAIALELAEEGYAVCVNYLEHRQQAEEVAETIRRRGGSAMAVQADVADRASVAAMVRETEAALGPVTLLVNNAGIAGQIQFQDITDEQIEANYVEAYKRLFYKYEEEKHLIPEGNLIEVRFEDFEKDAFALTEHIYQALDLPGFPEARAAIEAYLGKKKGYKKNQYKYEDRTVRVGGRADECDTSGRMNAIHPSG